MGKNAYLHTWCRFCRLAPVGRVHIETFRPDQPRIPGTGLSWSRLNYAIMAVTGPFWLLVTLELWMYDRVDYRLPVRLGVGHTNVHYGGNWQRR